MNREMRMGEPGQRNLSEESVRAAMDDAWRDHHHARDQTWRALQMEAVLGAGLVTVDAQFHNVAATACVGSLVVLAAISGVMISWHHRKLERRKFIHIMNCEDWLGLHRDDIIPKAAASPKTDTRPAIVKDGAVGVPTKMKLRDIISPKAHNTALFILRMHVAIMGFALIMIIVRCLTASH
jgi:hypothetical protein